MPNKKSTAKQWLLAPREVGLNRDTDLLKLIAMVTMFIDHLGAMLQAYYYKKLVSADVYSIANYMRYIGRVAFPIYAYCIAVGCVYSKNRSKYLSRIAMLGLISQPIYVYAMEHMNGTLKNIRFSEHFFSSALKFYLNSWWDPSIFLTLALGLLIIWCIREKKLVLTLAMVVVVWAVQGAHTGWDGIDYKWQGVALIVLFYLFIQRWWLSLPVILAFMIWWCLGNQVYLFGVGFRSEVFALLALPLIYIPTYSKIKINKWVFYWYYPAHLLVLIVIKYFIRLAHG